MVAAVEFTGFDMVLEELHQRLLETELKVATAESCTGGMLGALLTAKSGSSKYYAGGIISYSNEAKSKVLGVESSLVEAHGAVSYEVGCAMALQAKSVFDADIGVGVTGIAGPTGATPGKPVGTVWLAIAYKDSIDCSNLELNGSRAQIRAASSHQALKRILLLLDA